MKKGTLILIDDPARALGISNIAKQFDPDCHTEIIDNSACGRARTKRLCQHGGFENIVICYLRHANFMPPLVLRYFPQRDKLQGVSFCSPHVVKGIDRLLGITCHWCGLIGLQAALNKIRK